MVNEQFLSGMPARLAKMVPPENEWTPVDRALFTCENFFDDYDACQEQRFTAVKHSFEHHFTNNRLYHRLCLVEEMSPEKLTTTSEYLNIPLLPDTFFKDYPDGKGFLQWLETISTGMLPKPVFKSEAPSPDEVIDVFNAHGVNIMFTSGTSGRFSFIPRDARSLNRLKFSAMKTVIELMDYDPDDRVALLIPDPRQTNLTIASLFGIAYDLYTPENIHVALDMKITTQFLRMQQAMTVGISEKLKAKAMAAISPMMQKSSDGKIIQLLRQAEKDDTKVVIGGPPFWLDRILDRMRKEGHYVNLKSSQVLTGGGWKADEDKRAPEDVFRKKVQEVLGIPQERYHDVYAMSECSSVFMSCKGHYKHIPPLLVPFVLNEELDPVGYDKYGRFAFIDPLAEMYPGFIVTGDRVKLLQHCPACGRKGPVLDVEVTRVPGVEGRGCAAVMQELMKQGD